MSTNSFIGILENNQIRGNYCHFNGFLDDNGKMLFEHYQDEDKIHKLINLGSLSYLDEEVEPKSDIPHTFYKPQKNVTLAYHRDRKDPLKVYEFKKMESFKEHISSSTYEYIYIRFKGVWFYVKKLNGKFVAYPLDNEKCFEDGYKFHEHKLLKQMMEE